MCYIDSAIFHFKVLEQILGRMFGWLVGFTVKRIGLLAKQD